MGIEQEVKEIGSMLSLLTGEGKKECINLNRRKFNRLVLDHAEKYIQRGRKPCNIILVHPHYHDLESSVSYEERCAIEPEEKEEFDANIGRLLHETKDRCSRILFERVSDYIERSHELVEQGLIDYVIFTAQYRGCPDRNVMNKRAPVFADAEYNYVAGAYLFRCIHSAIRKLRYRHKVPFSKIILVDDALLNKDDYGEWMSSKELQRIPRLINSLKEIRTEGVIKGFAPADLSFAKMYPSKEFQ